MQMRQATRKQRERESSPVVADIEFFRGVQEEVGLCAVGETRRNLLNASLQYFRVEYNAICPGRASLAWRSVEWVSVALVRMTSVLDGLITAMGVNSSMFQHRADLRGVEK